MKDSSVLVSDFSGGEHRRVQEKLDQWHATAVCGNDITSSCLYVSALALIWAGPLAPVSLILVAGVLWLFRGIYSEVVGALPLNGGAYNALLNTTSKYRASIAACLTILSYLATAVISGSEAVHYMAEVVKNFRGYPLSLDSIQFATVALLGVFALLTIRGIGESARVALVIFIFHISSLFVLLISGVVWIGLNGAGVFLTNLASSAPKLSSHPLIFGFAVAMLGISGFESSANFVEEQKPGVFPKTLRNMWVAVSFFNPLMCLLALALIPLSDVVVHKEALLAQMGSISAGAWLANLISVDAALVLSGAVLTSFVGVTGLMHRMALDRCIPQFFLKAGRFKTSYRIIVSFFVLCSVMLFVAGDLSNLAGVYTISFLGVMVLFCFGNMLLKVKRSRLPRETKVSWFTLFLGAASVLTGLVGNIVLEASFIKIFLVYFIPTLFLVSVMVFRIRLLKACIFAIESFTAHLGAINRSLTDKMEEKIHEINSQVMVFFTRGDNISNLNEAMLYVRRNEHTNKIKIVTVIKEGEKVPEGLEKDLEYLDRAYPEIDIEFVVIKDKFTPQLLEKLSKRWKIPLNFMFIGSPGDHFPHSVSELGGVRLII